MKKKLYTIIFESDTPLGKLFDVSLLVVIVLSVVVAFVESMAAVPAAWKRVFTVSEYFFTLIFTLEYLLRLYCAPSRRRYALSAFGIIDLISTLPLYIGWIVGPARYLVVVRAFRLMRVFRVFKLFAFLKEGDNILRSLMLSARRIMVFFLFVVVMVIALGTLMYMVEGTQPDTQFTDIPASVYWAVVTMTTVGYGDIAPVTPAGRFLSALIMLLGYTIMAVPTGIISAQFVADAHRRQQRKPQRRCTECGCPLPEGAKFCPYCGNEQ